MTYSTILRTDQNLDTDYRTHATRGEGKGQFKAKRQHVLVATLDRLDFEVERDERENETLGKGLIVIGVRRRKSYLQILHQIVEDAKSFWILTVLDINQGPNFRSLASC